MSGSRILQEWKPLALGRRAGSALLGILYPPRCISCGTGTGNAHALCAACWRGINWISRPFCERLGTPFAVDIGGPLLSLSAIADPPVFACARAAASYDGVARDLVHQLKFADREDLAVAMGRLMAAAGGEMLTGESILVPIPLHWTRLWRRRFNQSAALATEIARLRGNALEVNLLRRVKRTRPQIGLTKSERRENLQGAFRVNAEDRHRIAGRHAVLIDDVMTSSSTVNAAARILLRAGAKRVDVLTFAVVAAAQ